MRDALRATLWPIPTLALVLAVALGFAVPAFDRRVVDSLPGWLLTRVIFNGDAGAAQTVLDAISSSLITVTSLTFSLTVVTLQLASSQFSPRLLRTFSSDVFVQATLALFLGTFVYSLTVLRLIRSEDNSAAAFVPRIAVTLSFVLAVVSVFMLVLFLAHLTETIRVESMLRNVHDEAVATMRANLTTDDGSAPSTLPSAPEGAEELAATESGFLTGVDRAGLLRAAVAADAVVLLDARPGAYVVRGVPLGRAWRVGGGALTAQQCDDLAREVCREVHVGFERTAAQDVAFGLRQLTDVANKALSPGINDPTTAVHAIGHLASLLCDLADRDLGPRTLRDEDGQVRVVIAEPDFADLVEVAITQPRRYGAGDPEVVAQLFRLLDQLAHRVPVRLGPVVVSHLGRLEDTVATQDFDEHEAALLTALAGRVRETLDRRDRRRSDPSGPSDPAGATDHA